MRASTHLLGRVANILAKAVLVNTLPEDLVRPDISIKRARELFAHYVDQVEIENHNFCNRVCWFCPNSSIDRRSQLRLMSPAVFGRIIDDLRSVDFDGALTWSRYHEAMADDSIFERVAIARAALPSASLVMVSNSDYLKRETLSKLEAAGVDRLMLDLYLPDGKERDPNAVAAGLRKFQRRTGHELQANGAYNFRVLGLRMKTTLEIPLYTKENISTRGGLVDVPKLASYRRRSVCLAPVRHMVIDYNGKGMLCCQTMSDSPAQRAAIIGDLSSPGYGLFHLYRDLGKARRALLSPGEKTGVCTSCDVRDDGPDRLARRDWFANAVNRLPATGTGVVRLWHNIMRRRFAG